MNPYWQFEAVTTGSQEHRNRPRTPHWRVCPSPCRRTEPGPYRSAGLGVGERSGRGNGARSAPYVEELRSPRLGRSAWACLSGTSQSTCSPGQCGSAYADVVRRGNQAGFHRPSRETKGFLFSASVIDPRSVQAHLETEYRLHGEPGFTLRVGQASADLLFPHSSVGCAINGRRFRTTRPHGFDRQVDKGSDLGCQVSGTGKHGMHRNSRQ